MAQATEEQLKKLETAHKQLLVALIQGGTFRLALSDKFGLHSSQFRDYNSIFNQLLDKWIKRTNKLEQQSGKKLLPEWIYAKLSTGGWLGLFNTRAGVSQLAELARQIDKEGKGIGFIPLIIWAVLGIAGLFTASYVVDETNNTATEQKELIDSTANFCTKNNLSPADCQKLLTQQTEAVQSEGGFFAGLRNLLLWVIGGVVVVKFVIPQFTSKKQAA